MMSQTEPRSTRSAGISSDTEQLLEARRIILAEAETLRVMAGELDPCFCDSVRLLSQIRGSVITTGVGKAGLIARKISATLSSTGTRSHFLHPTEALHGDLGCVSADDVVLALSNSGESEELTSLLPTLRTLRVPVIAMSSSSESSLGRAATVLLRIGKHAEAGVLGLAPSCSTTAMLAMGDALALVVSQLRGFSAADFSVFHPAGSLGRKLRAVADVMRRGDEVRIASETSTVREVMVQLGRPGRRTGAVMLVNSAGRLSGVFTDSDLARLFENHRDDQIDQAISQVMTRSPVTVSPEVFLSDAIEVMSSRKLSELPVTDSAGIPLGMVDITDVLQHAEASACGGFVTGDRDQGSCRAV